ncbi:MAG TPA: OsmC family protein [Burkholderiaceae bacterium]|nr:OsmC family protein [Burkholderiaceae bacterium]
MDAEQLKSRQAPLKQRYREDAGSARWVLNAEGELRQPRITCQITSGHSRPEAGLHPATGGDGTDACSGDMLLEALGACAGVTLTAVATALGITLRGGSVHVEGDLDFRGTLGVAKDVPVGFPAIRLRFDIDSDATPEQLDSLLKLTERYCVIYQTLRNPPAISVSINR